MPPESILLVKKIVPAVFLALLWLWETRRPFLQTGDRWRHAGHNLALALTNTIILPLPVRAASARLSAR